MPSRGSERSIGQTRDTGSESSKPLLRRTKSLSFLDNKEKETPPTDYEPQQEPTDTRGQGSQLGQGDRGTGPKTSKSLSKTRSLEQLMRPASIESVRRVTRSMAAYSDEELNGSLTSSSTDGTIENLEVPHHQEDVHSSKTRFEKVDIEEIIDKGKNLKLDLNSEDRALLPSNELLNGLANIHEEQLKNTVSIITIIDSNRKGYTHESQNKVIKRMVGGMLEHTQSIQQGFHEALSQNAHPLKLIELGLKVREFNDATKSLANYAESLETKLSDIHKWLGSTSDESREPAPDERNQN